MRIKISHWYGRFGNNVLQLSNACGYALENNCVFESPNHNILKSFTINNHLITNEIFSNLFFYGFEKYNLKRHDIIKEYIRPNLINIDPINLDNNTLVIHIRSGDVFGIIPHTKYIQNPLSYFISIIENFEKTIIVCEDYNNPVIGALSELKSVTVHSTTFEKDLSLILSAKNLCLSGVGTFGPICAMLSKNIQNLFITNIVNIDNQWIFNNDISVHNTYINLDNYICPNSWANTDTQRSLMMTYQI